VSKLWSTLKSARTTEIATLLCLTAFYLYIASLVLGISFRDDTDYLRSGILVNRFSFLSMQQWTPLYALWFKFLALFCPNPVWRYFLSWGLLASFIALLPAWMKMPRAWVYTFLVLCFPFLTVSPYVSLFAASIILLGLCLVLQHKSSVSGALASSCIVCFVVGFCRPEFDYGVYLSAIGTIVALVFEHSSGKSIDSAGARVTSKRSAIATGVAVASLAAAMLYVLAHAQHNRSGIAFAQHYSVRASERGLVPKGDAAWNSDYTERTFGIDTSHDATHGTASIADFARANPRLFLRHILTNLCDSRTALFLPLVLVVAFLPWFRRDLCHLRAASAFFLVLSVPPLADIVVIYPRDHYAILLVPALILLAVQLAVPLLRKKPPVPWVLAFGFTLIWFLTLHRHHPATPGSALTGERLNLRRIQCVRNVDQAALSSNSAVFDIALIPAVYLVHPRTGTAPADLRDWSQFTTWAAQTRPAWISVDADLATQYHVTPMQLDQFLQNELGYTQHLCPAEAQLAIYTNDQ
jgi:hypothetical protein